MARILIADDNKDIVILLRDYLEEAGHQVRSEMDGLQVGVQAKGWKPNLLVTDIQMPNFYGTTAAVSLQESPETASIPIIFISAVEPSTAEKMIDGIRGKVKRPDRIRFIAKPIDFKLLDRFIKELLAP